MSLPDVTVFVRQWHEAVSRVMTDDDEANRLEDDATALMRSLASDINLRSLCINPLLCALICALNRERRRQLPKNQLSVYRAALEMLLERRDREREVDGSDLSAAEAIYLLQDLAAYFVRNGWADIDIDRAGSQIKRSLRNLGARGRNQDVTMRGLIERSGIIREPVVGRVDFIHKTFQELLAARHAVENDEIGLLVAKSDDDQWRNIVILAVAQMTAKQANEFVRNSLSGDPAHLSPRKRLLLLSCLQNVVALDHDLRSEVESLASSLIPPQNMETAQVLATVGNWVLGLLTSEVEMMTHSEAASSIRTASLIGGTEALQFIALVARGFRSPEISEELVRAWTLFNREKYAKLVFPSVQITRLRLTDPMALAYLAQLPSVEELELVDLDRIDLKATPGALSSVRRLIISGSDFANLDGIQNFTELTHLTIELDRAGTDLKPLLGLRNLQCLQISSKDQAMLGLLPLSGIKSLRLLQIRQPSGSMLSLGQFTKFGHLTIVVTPGLQLLARDFHNIIEMSELPHMI